MYQNTRPVISILDQFTPEVLGIFWMTPEALNRDLQAFDEFNYLFDGLISQYIYGQEKTTDGSARHAHVFFTENFNDRIFLAHLKTQNYTKSQVAGDIDEQIALIQASNKNGERKSILIFDKTEHHWVNELKKRYPQFEFKELVIN